MTDWSAIIGSLKNKEYFTHAISFVKAKRAEGETVYPPEADVFNAFKYTPFETLKVIILGQDPYHEEGEAMGLSFSVPVGIRKPPSLQNIYKELQSEYADFIIPDHGNLIPWARQGVLLLNSTLTVTQGKAGSHRGQGWEEFTDDVVKNISQTADGLVFLLWGNYARSKAALIDRQKHLVLECAHPSPFSASQGFFGCGHFRKANEYLAAKGKRPIDWRLPLHLDGDEEL